MENLEINGCFQVLSVELITCSDPDHLAWLHPYQVLRFALPTCYLHNNRAY